MRRYQTIGAVLGIFALSAWIPYKWIQGIPLCYFKRVTGLDCPGCGLTRAFCLFFKGEFHRSLAMNALAPVLILWLALYALREAYFLKTGVRPQWFTTQGNRVISRLFLVLFLSQWFWKTWLALTVS